MASKLDALRKTLSPEGQLRARERAAEIRREIPLHKLRQALSLTQGSVAEHLGVTQAAVSKVESSANMYVATLRRYVEATGGELEIWATYPGCRVRLDSLTEPAEPVWTIESLVFEDFVNGWATFDRTRSRSRSRVEIRDVVAANDENNWLAVGAV